MKPPRARTWGRIGRTPVVRVRGRGSGRVSMAGTVCYKPGERSRLIYTVREYRGRNDEPKGFGRRDFRDLITRADPARRSDRAGGTTSASISPERYGSSTRRTSAGSPCSRCPPTRRTSTRRRASGRCSGDIGNLAAADLGQITRAVKHRLKQIQYRPDLVDGCLAGAGLIMDG
jgi:hypothetical protein